MERFKDFSSSYLSTDINNSQAEIPVVDVTQFPTQGNFRVLVNSELMLATSVTASSLFVNRGIERTTAAIATSGTPVYHILTDGGFRQNLRDIVATGPLSGATFAASGSVYLPTDSNAILVSRDSVNYRSWGPLLQMTPPVTGNFTWVNQGTATMSSTVESITITTPASSSVQLRMLDTAMPSGSYILTAMLISTGIQLDTHTWGIFIRNSVSGRIQSLALVRSSSAPTSGSSLGIVSSMYYSPTVYNSDALALQDTGAWIPYWLRIVDDTVNITYQFSRNGLFWYTFGTMARDFWVAQPDRLGFFLDVKATLQAPIITLLHWKIQ